MPKEAKALLLIKIELIIFELELNIPMAPS